MAGKTKVTGFNIYKDKLNRDVYYDALTKEGYVIRPKDVGKLNFYKKRFIIPIIIFSLTYSFEIMGFSFGVLGAAVAALLSYVLVEIVFRFKFLRSMITLPHFVPNKKEDYFHQLAASSPLSSLIIKGILYIVLGSLLIAFGMQEGFGTFEWIACVAITIVLIIVGLFQLYAAYLKHSSK